MKFESYIHENRNKLDVEKPDEDYLWTGISQSINVNKKRYWVYWISSIAAASFVLIVTLAFLMNRSNKQQLIFVNDPALAGQEAQLVNQINTYSNLIKKTSFNTDQLATNSKEIQYIDDLIGYYTKDLKQNGSNPKLVNSLMDLYQKKIMLLERMLNEIEKSKDHEKRKIDI